MKKSKKRKNDQLSYQNRSVLRHSFAGVLSIARKRKMHGFNRFYLLFSIAFSFLVPVITIEGQKQVLPFSEPSYMVINSSGSAPAHDKGLLSTGTKEQSRNPDAFVLVYFAVMAFFLFRFTKNLLALSKKIRTTEKLYYQNARLVLCSKHPIPYSFLNYIFVDKEAYEKGNIEKEILHHELAHVRQKHSWDILFMELLLGLAWFNPVFYAYKKAIQLNHEFLADDDVVKSFHNTASYQYLLLNKTSSTCHSLLASSFNYLITKKRLVMMTKTTSTIIISFKQLALLPLAALLIFIFSTKMAAQAVKQPGTKASPKNEQGNTYKKDTAKLQAWVGLSVGHTAEGVPEELMNEYQALINKYKKSDSIYWKDFENVGAQDRSRMETIFRQMSLQQQDQQVVRFIKNPPPLPRLTPGKEQFNRFKDADMYGIWINEKRVANEELNRYENTDFSQVFVSKLYGAAKKGRTYSYQVDLMTNNFYNEYYNNAIAEGKTSMMVVLHRLIKGTGMHSIE